MLDEEASRFGLRRVAVATGLGLAGRVAVLVLGLASVALTTRYLGAEGYGRLALVLSFTQLFAVVADAGLTTVVVRELAARPERAPAVLGSALALRAGLALAAVGAAALTALALPYPPPVRLGVLLAGVPLALGLLNSAAAAVLQAELRAGRAALADVAGRAGALGALGIVVALDLGFYAVLGAAGVGAAVTLAVTAGLVRPLLAARPRAEPGEARALARAALPLGLALALNEAYFRADALIISLSRPFAELGAYALAWRVSELAASFPGVLLVAVFPVLARHLATGHHPRAARLLDAAGDALLLAGLGLAVGGALVAEPLVRALGGEALAGAAGPLRVLLAASALGFVSGLLGHALIAGGRSASTLWTCAGALGLNVALNVALVPRHGIQAAAWIALGCEVLVLGATALLLRRALGLRYGFGALGRGVVAAGVMAAALWPLRDGPLWLSLALGATAYLGALAALGTLDRDALAALR